MTHLRVPSSTQRCFTWLRSDPNWRSFYSKNITLGRPTKEGRGRKWNLRRRGEKEAPRWRKSDIQPWEKWNCSNGVCCGRENEERKEMVLYNGPDPQNSKSPPLPNWNREWWNISPQTFSFLSIFPSLGFFCWQLAVSDPQILTIFIWLVGFLLGLVQ